MSRHALLLVAVLGLGGCLDSGGPPRPGAVTATLHSPNGDEGAAVLFFPGETFLDVRAEGDAEAYAATGPDGTRVVLVARAGSTLAFQARIDDVDRPPVGLVREVAGPDDELRPDLSDYTVEITP